jgi:acetyltransferase-like isoleucine patch superfamily enzyme
MSGFYEMFEALSPDELEKIAEKIAPLISAKQIMIPTYFGGGKVHVGHCVSLVNTLFNLSSGNVYIEDFVFFGHNVTVLTGTHAIDKFNLERQTSIPSSGRDVVIEQGAWISSNATLIGPCRIGRNAVVGVGAVVTTDIRAGWFYGGCPARPIKMVSPAYDVAEAE